MAETQTEIGAAGADVARLYRDMLLIRRFEEKAGQLYGMGLIGGFCHLSIGQEAVAVGLEAAAEAGDRRITGPRCHGQMLACGIDPQRIMAELLGRANGLSRGKGGSMHMFSKPHGFFGGHGIPGTQLPVALGLAFAQQRQSPGRVTFCCFGDRVAEMGTVYESYGLAQSWSLPLVLVIENNSDTAQDRIGTGSDLLRRAKGFGLRTVSVDGMDVLAVRDAARGAVADCRTGRGPVVIEAHTRRFRGHALAQSDAERQADRRAREKLDPLAHLADRMVADGIVSQKTLKDMDREIRQIVADCTDAARADAPPAADALRADVYAGDAR